MADSQPAAKNEVDSVGSSLCTQCGLCCMGVIHASAVLDEDEIAEARALGLPVLDSGRPAFALPCPRLEGSRCGIYRDRPRVCARYKCQLLQDLEGGVRDLGESMARVDEAKQLLGKVRALIPAGRSYFQVRRDHGQMPTAAPPREDADRTILVLALELFLDRHFRNEKDRRSFEEEADRSRMEFDMQHRVFSRSEEAIFAEIGEDVVALNIPSGRCHGMEEVAAEVWRILAEPTSLDEICDQLMSSYEVDPDECRSDVAALLGTMAAEGLIKAQ